MLPHCPSVFGDCIVGSGEPRTEFLTEAIYMPLHTSMVEDRWGLYHGDGRLCEEAAYKRGPGRVLVGQAEQIEVPDRLEFVEGEFIYGGAVQGHYGHFLLGMLPRYWLDFSSYPNATILLHSHIDLDVIFSIPFLRQIFEALGLTRDRFRVLTTPSRLSRVIVPEALFQEMSSANVHFATLSRQVADRLDEVSACRKDVAYLSKERLAAGVWRVSNEDIIVGRLRKEGVDIFYPETMSLAEQIAVFESYDIVCGLMGSALHTSLFSRKPNKILGLNHNPSIWSNFPLIDAIKQNEALYVYPGETMRTVDPAHGMNSVFECGRPERLAEDLLATLNSF